MKILVGFPPGGSADVTARALADKLKDSLGQAIVIDNRAGAGGRVAADALKNSAADGTTLEYAELHRNGKLTILALSGSGRSAAFPDVPTFKEAGVDVDGTGWFGMHAPAATPRAIVERQAGAIAAAMHQPDMRERLFRLGLEATGTTPEEFVRLMQQDKARWEPVIRAIGFRID